jgi:hypothetical protein
MDPMAKLGGGYEKSGTGRNLFQVKNLIGALHSGKA